MHGDSDGGSVDCDLVCNIARASIPSTSKGGPWEPPAFGGGEKDADAVRALIDKGPLRDRLGALPVGEAPSPACPAGTGPPLPLRDSCLASALGDAAGEADNTVGRPSDLAEADPFLFAWLLLKVAAAELEQELPATATTSVLGDL